MTFAWALIATFGYMTSTGYVNNGRVHIPSTDREACVQELRSITRSDVRDAYCINRLTGEVIR